MKTESGVVAGSSRRLNAGVGPCNHRPRVRVRGRLAGEVASVELRQRSVDVVDVECDDRDAALVGVDLADGEHLCGKCLGPSSRSEQTDTHEDEALPADRNDGRFQVRVPQLGDRPHVDDVGVTTMLDSRAHHRTAIIMEKSSAMISAIASQSPAAKAREESLVDTACRVFQAPRWSTELLEAGERGVEVCLVEYLAAVDQVAFERRKV